MYADSIEKYKYLSELTEADIIALTRVLDSKVVADRVQEKVYELGTSDIVLTGEGTDAGYIPFSSVLKHGDTCSYVIEGVKKTLQCNGQFEIGIGVWNEHTNALIRKTVVYSNIRDNVSGGYQKINFVADREPYNGFHKVWISLSAEDIKSWQSVIKAFSQDVLYVRDVLETIEDARIDALNQIDDNRKTSLDTINSRVYGVREDGSIRTEYEEDQSDPCVMTDIVTIGNSYTTLMVVAGDEILDSIEDKRSESALSLESQYNEHVSGLLNYKNDVDEAHDNALTSIESKVVESKSILDNHTGLRIDDINSRYNTVDGLIVKQGDAQVSRVQDEGNTQNNRVITTGNTWNTTLSTNGQLILNDIHGYTYGYDENGVPRDSYVSGTNDDGVLYDIEQAGRTYVAMIVVDGNTVLDKITEHETVSINNLNSIIANFNDNLLYEKPRNIGYRVLNKGVVKTRKIEFNITEAAMQVATFNPSEASVVDIVLSGDVTDYTYSIILALYDAGSVTLNFPSTINWMSTDGTSTTSFSNYLNIIGRSNLVESGLTQVSIWTIGNIYYGKLI